MSAQVFISYSNQDSAVAESIHDALEQAGIPAWMAHRDLPAGVSWSQRIVDEIHASRVMILVLSRHANESRYVIREVAEAVDSHTAIVTVRIENVSPSHALKFFIAAEQWLDAYAMPRERYERRLIDDVGLLLGTSAAPPGERDANARGGRGSRLRLRDRRVLRAVLAVTAVILVGMYVLPALGPPLVIETPPGEILVGDSLLLALASGQDAAVWSSSDPEVLRVSPGAAVSHATGTGRAWLIARAGSRSDSVSVNVKRAPADSITIVAPASSIRVGDSLELTATVYDRASRPIIDPQLRWSTDAPRIAAVSDHGVVEGIAPGRARISARADSVSTSVAVTVAARSTRPPLLPDLRDPAVTVAVDRGALPSEADLTRAANQCLAALKRRDIEWIAANYKPPTPADQNNLDRLTSVMRQARYTVTNSGVGAVQADSRSAEFWAEFSYTASFGRSVRARGTFRVLVESSAGAWPLAGCRVAGSIITS